MFRHLLSVRLVTATGSLVVAGCGGASASEVGPPPSPPAPKVALDLGKHPRSVITETAKVRGRVTPGAIVTIGGKEAWVRGGTFRLSVDLAQGSNRFRVVARKAGYKPTRTVVSLKRTLPPPPAEAQAPSSNEQEVTPPSTTRRYPTPEAYGEANRDAYRKGYTDESGDRIYQEPGSGSTVQCPPELTPDDCAPAGE